MAHRYHRRSVQENAQCFILIGLTLVNRVNRSKGALKVVGLDVFDVVPSPLFLVLAGKVSLQPFPLLLHELYLLLAGVLHSLVLVLQEVHQVCVSSLHLALDVISGHLLEFLLDFLHIVLSNFALGC